MLLLIYGHFMRQTPFSLLVLPSFAWRTKVRQEEVLFTASGGKKLLLRVLRAFCLNFLHVQILAIDPRTRRGIFGSGTPERKCRDILFLPAGILCELRGLSLACPP